ncbi:hypothetical protein J5N97_029057 [Dioscorea zingiberensis]|uniref:Uncharacterized protein n=1 Tax=Dioscorea zingiberensis TaxID=325984 RepID=A0A9D5BZY1_9LILI|nr:hypothetical protein J5N97_029057 [Dioscorea zingiberensis]
MAYIWESSGSPPSSFTVPSDAFRKQVEMNGGVAKDLDYDFICLFLSGPYIDLYRAIDLSNLSLVGCNKADEVIDFVCDVYHEETGTGRVVAPEKLKMMKDVNGRQETYELKS